MGQPVLGPVLQQILQQGAQQFRATRQVVGQDVLVLGVRPAAHRAETVQGRGADPGGEVAVGQVIGLIEAMKLFNEIKSDLAGRVVKVVAESGALVKAKQPLIEVEPL